MKFYAEPNMLVRINKNIHRRLKSFRFDSSGIYETDNERLINALKRRFKYDEEQKKQCKQCDFKCDNQGELLAHYKNVHPKKV